MPRLPSVALVALLAAGGLSAQQAPPAPIVFRAEVNYVEVDAIVTDARGNAVPSLRAADFEVLEDGTPQTIAAFTRVDLPVQRAEQPLFASTPIEPDVRTNAAIEGGIYLIVLDDLHTDFDRTLRVKETARRFIERAVGPNDVAAVVYTGRNDASQEFTANRRLLLEAVDKFAGQKLRSATLIALEGVGTRPDAAGNTVLQLGEDVAKPTRAYRARSVMGSIRQLSEFMAGVHGRRKAMVLFGEGIDYDVEQAMGADGATASVIIEDFRSATAAAQRGNVTIYTVDPRGLFDPADDLVQTSSQFNRETPEVSQSPLARITALNNRGIGRAPPPAEANGATLQAEVRLGQESLRALARDTGGFSVLNTNDFSRAFERIVRENSAYYLLGYYPTNDRRDGKLRKLQVRVKRSGLTVHARKGYAAPTGATPAAPPAGDTKSSPIADALGSPLPVSGVPMRLFAASFKGTAPLSTVAFVIEFDASPFNFTQRDGAWVESLEVASVAVEVNGTLRPSAYSKMALTLKPATYDAVSARGVRVLGQTDLPPGRYQLRIAVGTGTGKAGSVVCDLEVPDYSKGLLTMSGIAFTSVAASQMPTLTLKDPLGRFLPGPPVATRSFTQDDQLTLFGEVYDNDQSSAVHEVTIITTLRSDTGAALRTTTDRRSSVERDGRSGGYGFIAGMPLDDLQPGLYVIHVEARSEFGARPSAGRDIQIRVTSR